VVEAVAGRQITPMLVEQETPHLHLLVKAMPVELLAIKVVHSEQVAEVAPEQLDVMVQLADQEMVEQALLLP